jgi:RNA ligase
MTTSQAVASLRRLVKRLVTDKVTSKDEFRTWRKEEGNARFMAECLGYEQREGMPAATAIVQPFFHPDLPLIGLGYTQVAHNTLHNFQGGWTRQIRLCRGIIFDRKGKVVAFPFPKFFNHGEGLTGQVPGGPFEATLKHDGHLGIIFEYEGELYITTRGSFVSKTSKFATEMLNDYREKWRGVYPKNVTTLVEIIHPETHVIVDYGDAKNFTVIGLFNRRSYKDCQYKGLVAHAKLLGLPVTEIWTGDTVDDLIKLMHDLSIDNQEGYVARFKLTGERLKFKLKRYIGKMIADKLTVKWVMARLQDGSLERRSGDLPGEVQGEIKSLQDKVLGVQKVKGVKERQTYMYELEPKAEERTDYYKGLCRKFLRWVDNPTPVKAADEEEAA